MNNKYFVIGGFAFSEESDMKKLSEYAKEGWILEGISGGFFYKLKKGKPQDIEYTLDYQNEAAEEYFDLFSQAGWTHVVSLDNMTHIFSAPVGTKPIYTEHESEKDKYDSMKKLMGKGSIYSFIAVIVFTVLLGVSAIFIKPLFIVICILFIISICVFICSFMPYLAFKCRINKLNEHEDISGIGTKVYILNAIVGICFLLIGIHNLMKKSYFSSVVFILIAVLNIILFSFEYKNSKILSGIKRK